MKTILTLIVGMIVGYGVSAYMPAQTMMAKFLSMDMPDMSGGHEMNVDAGSTPEGEKPKTP